MNKTKLKAIIFDADGVIFDSEKLWDIGDGEFLARRGVSGFPGDLKSRLAGTSLHHGTTMILEAIGAEENIDLAAAERVGIMERLYAEQIAYNPGFEAFFSYVEAGKWQTAVATSMSKTLFPVIDDRLGFLQLFEGRVFSVNDVEHAKPAPDIYYYAAERVGVAPQNCLVIEDSPNGIKAAKAAGMYCIGLATTFGREKLTGADKVYLTFDEIRQFIDGLT